jgi:pimeloyl-ACP methyl ester carboxylesterase
MKNCFLWAVVAATLAGGSIRAQNLQHPAKAVASAPKLPPHDMLITVDKNVKLEVLDWGGSGRPIVLLAGLGDTAHVFDNFASKLTATYHVYGVTRRGFGSSSAPAPSVENYSADRLGDDVVAVINALKLNRPVLVGHSIAGEELSSVGTRHPDKIAALIYLEAAYSYAYYDRVQGDLLLDSLELRRKLELFFTGSGLQEQKQMVQELLQTSLPQFEKDLEEQRKVLQLMPAQTQQPAKPRPVVQAILSGQEKFTDIRVPILAIFAVPHGDLAARFKDDPAGLAAVEARDVAYVGAQAKALESGVPSARIVRLPNSDHYVFQSNEGDVLREINAFLASLP